MIYTAAGCFPPYGKSFRPKVPYGKSFRPDTPHPRGGASVELSEGESDPSQTYVSRLRVPVSPMFGPNFRKWGPGVPERHQNS